MTCEEYAVLLQKSLEEALTPAEEALLRAHEAECSACAAKALALNDLQAQLAALRDDTPPMPEDFHAGWLQRVEDCAMEQKQTRKRPYVKLLSAAAALVFVVGGTLLTRDSLNKAPTAAPQMKMAEYESESYDTTAEYGYSMARSYSADTGGGMNNAAPMIAGSAAVPEDVEAILEESGQKIIRTASLTIASPTYADSLAQLKALCGEMNGWVSYSSESERNARRTASLTLRIPSEHLSDFLEGTGSIGRITRREETADDVTESYQDTAARLSTQKALMERLKALITDAADLSDLLALESQIADTQYTIDRLQSSLNSTDRQVDYATVNVTLREELPEDGMTMADATLAERFVSALSTGWKAFISFVKDAVVFLAAALPFIVVVAIVYAVAHIIVRRRKRHHRKEQ